MRILIAVGLVVWAGQARADFFSEQGWFTGCDDTGCQIVSAGYRLTVNPQSPGGVIEFLQGLAPVSSVWVAGELSDIGDSTAAITVDNIEQVDDINEGNLQFMQGDWAPNGEESPYFVRISGLTYEEWQGGEVAASFLIGAGDRCADGTTHKGTIISLYAFGGDPSTAACRQLEYIDEATMSLRDLSGDWQVVDYTRVVGQ